MDTSFRVHNQGLIWAPVLSDGLINSHRERMPCISSSRNLQPLVYWPLPSKRLKLASLIYSVYLPSNLQEQVITSQVIDS